MNETYTVDPLNPPSTDFSMLDYECAYLPGNKVRMHYKYIESASKTFASAVVQRGWRRFGKYFFHPVCAECNECKSLRIDAENFKPTKSQRKAINRNKHTRILIQKPSLTQSHLGLYNAYHRHKNIKDGWSHRNITQREYYENFVDGAHDFGKEVLYIVDDRLVGVDLIDILDDGISAIYFYYHPSYGRLSLGVYSLLYQIDLAKRLGLKWIYLGYWVYGCKAFEYKTKFTPLQILEGFPPIDQKPNWIDWQNPGEPFGSSCVTCPTITKPPQNR